MRIILLACFAIGAASIGFAPSAQAADPYWQSHHDVQWQSRTEFKEPEHQKTDWLRDHCIRNWDGKEMCRR